MIDKVLAAGASFDYVSPLVKVLGDLAHGGGYAFSILPCHMAYRDIELLLRRHGVGTWGALVVGDRYTVTVRKSDAQRANSILQANDVPVENPPPMQARQSRQKRKPSGGVFSVFDDVFKR
jgi:hypothetical protein